MAASKLKADLGKDYKDLSKALAFIGSYFRANDDVNTIFSYEFKEYSVMKDKVCDVSAILNPQNSKGTNTNPNPNTNPANQKQPVPPSQSQLGQSQLAQSQQAQPQSAQPQPKLPTSKGQSLQNSGLDQSANSPNQANQQPMAQSFDNPGRIGRGISFGGPQQNISTASSQANPNLLISQDLANSLAGTPGNTPSAGAAAKDQSGGSAQTPKSNENRLPQQPPSVTTSGTQGTSAFGMSQMMGGSGRQPQRQFSHGQFPDYEVPKPPLPPTANSKNQPKPQALNQPLDFHGLSGDSFRSRSGDKNSPRYDEDGADPFQRMSVPKNHIDPDHQPPNPFKTTETPQNEEVVYFGDKDYDHPIELALQATRLFREKRMVNTHLEHFVRTAPHGKAAKFYRQYEEDRKKSQKKIPKVEGSRINQIPHHYERETTSSHFKQTNHHNNPLADKWAMPRFNTEKRDPFENIKKSKNKVELEECRTLLKNQETMIAQQQYTKIFGEKRTPSKSPKKPLMELYPEISSKKKFDETPLPRNIPPSKNNKQSSKGPVVMTIDLRNLQKSARDTVYTTQASPQTARQPYTTNREVHTPSNRSAEKVAMSNRRVNESGSVRLDVDLDRLTKNMATDIEYSLNRYRIPS